VVAICDHLRPFRWGKPESEVLREAAAVALDLAAEQPRRDLRQDARTGERRDVAVRKLPAVGVARLEADPVVALDDRNFVAVARQVVGRGEPDHAAAETRMFIAARRAERAVYPGK